MKKQFFLYPLALLVLGCEQPNTNTQIGQELADTTTVKKKKQIIEDVSIGCNELSISDFWEYYPDNEVTSGRTNKPDLFTDCILSQEQNFGFYAIYDRNSTLKPPMVAKVIVSFEKNPWNYSDDNQKIILLIVSDKLFKCNPFAFGVDDDLVKIDSVLTKLKTIENIHYYKQGSCVVAIKEKDGIVSKYIYWLCNNLSEEKIEQQHTIVKSYLVNSM